MPKINFGFKKCLDEWLAMILTLSFVIIFSPPTSAQTAEGNEATEPTLRAYLEISGKKYDVEVGKPFQLPPDASNATTLLRVHDSRTFSYGSIEFQYPSYFTFENTSMTGAGFWTLSGNDAKIIVQSFKITTDEQNLRAKLVQGLQNRYGEAKTLLSKAQQIKLGALTLSGDRLDIALVKTKLRQDVYSFKNSRGFSVILILQDSPDAKGEPSPEFRKLETMLRSSFKVK